MKKLFVCTLSLLLTNNPGETLSWHTFFLQTMNFYWIIERITFKIINVSIYTSPENPSTSTLLAQMHNWTAPRWWPVTSLQHCPNAFTRKIFLLNHLQPRKAAEIDWWVTLNTNTHNQKNQLPQNWNEARNKHIYEVINCFTAFLLIFPILIQQSLGFHRQSPCRGVGWAEWPTQLHISTNESSATLPSSPVSF